MEDKKIQIEYINLAYIIGTMLVVFGHSYPLNIHDVGIPEFMKIIQIYIYKFHMPLFFFISGLLFNYSNSISRIGYSNYIKKKFNKLMVPYFLLSIIGIVPKYIMGEINIDINSIIATLIYPRQNIWGHFWFIPIIFAIYCIFGKVIKNKESKRQIYIYLIISIVFYLMPINIKIFGINDICKYSIYFLIGIILSRLKYDFKSINTIYLLIISLSLFFINLNYGMYMQKIVDFFIAINMTIFIIQLSKMLINKYESTFIFNELKGNTYTIYLLSWIFQAPVEIILNRILHIPWYYVMIAMFITGIIMPLIILKIYRIVNIKSKVFKMIIGIEGAN